MKLREPTAEDLVSRWLRGRGYEVRKGTNVDVEACLDDRLHWVLEVKGDQENERAVRNSFLLGLGQLTVARARHRGIKVSFALTTQYRAIAQKYSDVLRHHELSILWVDHGRIELHEARPPIQAPSRGRRQGHPDGHFRCRVARFQVHKGGLCSVTLGSKPRGDIRTFAALCGALGIDIRGDSAARMLRRCSEAA